MEPDTSLYSLGVDSLSGANIAYEIALLTGQEVPSQLVAERDTITKLVDYVISVGGPR
jgi:acyl carrier protein